MIELNSVSYAYAGSPALKNINLQIKKGEAIALLGSKRLRQVDFVEADKRACIT